MNGWALVEPTIVAYSRHRTTEGRMISEASVRRAIDHLGSFGDTDLFPRLPEMRCFLERPGTVAKDCESLNIGQYTPVALSRR